MKPNEINTINRDKKNNFEKVINKLKAFEKVLLIIHENPDGDTLAAATVLYKVLKKLDKSPVLLCKDEIPKPFLFLDAVFEIHHDTLFGDYELIVVVDCGDLKRTGFPERLKKHVRSKNKFLINIDHHPKNDLHKIANINLVDFKASSTSEIVYELCEKMQIVLDKDMATSLLTGIYTDTGGFKHANTTEETLKIASDLMRSGARIKKISQNISLNKSVSAMNLWGIVLNRMRRHESLGIVSSVITQADLNKCKASDEDLAGVINLINTIPDSKAAIIFYETKDEKIRASIRTERDNIDVSRLANIFGGGGHKKASGFTVDGKFKFTNGSWKIV